MGSLVKRDRRASGGAITLLGELRTHEVAAELAEVVRRVHHRYATEVVGAFGLCPFMNDPETAFGKFVVVLDRALDVPLATECVLAAGVQVVHLIYPLIDAAPPVFERFGNSLHESVARRGRGGPVHATFHRHMEGDDTSPARLVGVFRRAPDPFVQFVPEGLHQGGSTFIDLEKTDLLELVKAAPRNPPPRDNAKHNFARLTALDVARVQAILADIHADRDRSYAPFLAALDASIT